MLGTSIRPTLNQMTSSVSECSAIYVIPCGSFIYLLTFSVVSLFDLAGPDAPELLKDLIVRASEDARKQLAIFEDRMKTIRQMFLEAGRSIGLKGAEAVDVAGDADLGGTESLLLKLATSASLIADTSRLGNRFLKDMMGGGEVFFFSASAACPDVHD